MVGAGVRGMALGIVGLALAAGLSPARGQHGSRGSGGGHHKPGSHHHHPGAPVIVGAPWWYFYPYGPPPVVTVAPWFLVGPPPLWMPPWPNTIAMGPPLGAAVAGNNPNATAPAANAPANAPARRPDARRSREYLTIGDRMFRANNLTRASERYEQALRADNHTAAPRLRLAQVALVRGKYAEAATWLREAQATEPGWILNAPDIQTLYAEPGDFTREINRLESHLQAHPSDRDAWLVLGAQLYLSGRTRRAADVFLRLTDREPDATLAAFLAASRADGP